MSIDADDGDISVLLEKWSKDKVKLAKLEERIEKYKKLAGKIMDERDKDNLSSSDYLLKRRTQTRSTISKSDVPIDVWKNYSRQVSFQAYYLVDKHEK
jgi:hypothetical protein